MHRRLPTLLLAASLLNLKMDSIAQQAQPAPPAVPDVSAAQQAGPTPPIAPNIVPTPVLPSIPTPTVPLPSDVPNRPLTADEAALIALRHQPNITIAQAGVAAAQGRVQQVRSGLLPTVTLNGSYSRVQVLSGNNTGVASSGGTGTGTTGAGGVGTGTTGTGGGGTGTTGSGGTGTGTGGAGGTGTGGTGTGTGSGGTGTGTGTGSGATTTTPLGSRTVSVSEGFVGTATLRQLIFDFNHTRDLVREAVALERASTQNLNAVQSNTVFQVKQAFYLYAENIHLVAVNQTNVANRQDQLALARARLNTGLGLPSDVVTAQTAVQSAQVALNEVENNASVSRVNLALLMGIDPRTPIVVADTTNEPPFPTNDVNALVTTALRQRPEVLQAQATIQANQNAVSAARTTNAPVLSGDLQFQSSGSQFFPQNDTFIVGAAIQFTPFDGGLTAGLVKEARANLLASQAVLIATQQTVASDVTQAYFNLRSAEQRVTVANAEVANATEDVRIAVGRYRSGLGLFQDIITAQGLLITANIDLVSAQASVDLARAALQRAIGSSLPAAGVGR